MKFPNLVIFSSLCALASACDAEDPAVHRSVQPVCVEEAPEAEDDAWVCDEVRTVSCEEAAEEDQALIVQLDEGACGDAELQGVDGPFAPGEHEIEIEDAAADDAVVCTATLQVTDDEAPEVETATDLTLWPPNHKMHEISLDDCLVEVDECDPDWDARILSVSSDEPDNDLGDGNTEGDIVAIDDQTVALRSERQGGSNGRVYSIVFEVEDGSGNATEDTCLVSVVHDQSGDAAIDDGPAYTVDWPDDE